MLGSGQLALEGADELQLTEANDDLAGFFTVHLARGLVIWQQPAESCQRALLTY